MHRWAAELSRFFGRLWPCFWSPTRFRLRSLIDSDVLVLEVRGRITAMDRRTKHWTDLVRSHPAGGDREVMLDLSRAKLGDPVVFSDFLVHAYNQLPRGSRQRLGIITGNSPLLHRLRSWFSIEGVEALFEPYANLDRALAGRVAQVGRKSRRCPTPTNPLPAASNGGR